MKKVYFDALPLTAKRPSGVSRVEEETVRALCRNRDFMRKYELVGFVPLRKKNAVSEKLKGIPVKLVTVPLPNKILELLLRSGFMFPLDLFLGTGVYIFFNYRNFPLARSLSITYVYDLGFIDFPQFAQKKNRKYLTRYIRRWIRRTDVVATISKYSKSRLQELLSVPKNKIEIVYCGVNLENSPGRDVIKDTLNKYDLPDSYLLFVGNIEPRKNLKGLVEAYGQTPDTISTNYPLVIIGADGWNNDIIYDTIESAKNNGYRIIIPDGYVNDKELSAIRSQAKAVISPSFYEGFSIPPLEALAQHIPIALSDIPVHKELYSDKAVFFDPNNIHDIARGIESVLKESASPMEDKFVNRFSWDATARKLHKVIDELDSR